MNTIYQHASTLGTLLLGLSVAVMLLLHSPSGKLIAAIAFALLALDCRQKATRHPDDSPAQRCYSGAGTLISIGAVATVISTLVPGAIPEDTHSVTLVAGAVATFIARRLEGSSSESEPPERQS